MLSPIISDQSNGQKFPLLFLFSDSPHSLAVIWQIPSPDQAFRLTQQLTGKQFVIPGYPFLRPQPLLSLKFLIYACYNFLSKLLIIKKLIAMALSIINQIQIPKNSSKQGTSQILSNFLSRSTPAEVACQITQHKPIYKNGNLCKVKTISFQTQAQLKSNIYALKVIYKDRIQKQEYESQQKRIHNQIKILYKLNSHPNIIKLYWHHQFEKQIWLLFQCFGVKLSKFIKKRKLTEDEIKKIVKQLCEILKVLHDDQGFIHRDISTDNILISQDLLTIKLIDFGFANIIIGGRRTQLGSFQYIAPEITKGLHYNHKADLWSLGIVIFQLFFGRNPFSSGKKFIQEQIKTNRLKMRYNFNPSEGQNFDVSQRAKDIIRKLLLENPDDRLQAREILQHPWFVGTIQLQKGVFDDEEDNFDQIFKKDQSNSNRQNQGSVNIIKDMEATQKKQQVADLEHDRDRGSFDNFFEDDFVEPGPKKENPKLKQSQSPSISPKKALKGKQIQNPARKTEKVPQISSASVTKDTSIRDLENLLCNLIITHGEELTRKRNLMKKLFQSQIKITELSASQRYGIFRK